MISNLEKYKKDLNALIDQGFLLYSAAQNKFTHAEFESLAVRKFGDKSKAKEFIRNLPSFGDAYQPWYSESRSLIHQLLPDRLDDFVRYYERPRNRKTINYETYRIEDCLEGLSLRKNPYQEGRTLGPHAAIPMFRQQLAILESVKRRFESSLFDIRQLVQADVLDSEVSQATELNRKGFARAAGAIAGVVLEKHLGQVCENHQVNLSKKHPTISDFNDALKSAEVIDTPAWRRIQLLGDIRNRCDHNKSAEPSQEDITELILGVEKLTKSLF